MNKNTTNLEFQSDDSGLRLNLPAGFRLTLRSWENDGDDYREVVLVGLSEADVRFYVDVAKLFQEGRDQGGLGNDYVPISDLIAGIKPLLAAHQGLSPAVRDQWSTALANDQARLDAGHPDKPGWYLHEQLVDKVLDAPVQYDSGFCRMFDSFCVQEIVEPVSLLIPLKNVSEKFSAPAHVATPSGRRPGF